MIKILLSITIFLSGGLARAESQLITSAGKHSFPEYAVTIDLASVNAHEMAVKVFFDLPSFKGSTGTGKDSPLKIAPQKWAAQFVAPNQLWIFDGLGNLRLYERTIVPSGFKASASDVVPTLSANAPKELRDFMAGSTVAK